MSAVRWLNATRDTERSATSVTEQQQSSVDVLVTLVSREVGQQLQLVSRAQLTTVSHRVTGQSTYSAVSLTARLAEMLIAVETVSSQTRHCS